MNTGHAGFHMVFSFTVLRAYLSVHNFQNSLSFSSLWLMAGTNKHGHCGCQTIQQQILFSKANPDGH